MRRHRQVPGPPATPEPPGPLGMTRRGVPTTDAGARAGRAPKPAPAPRLAC